MKFVGAEGELKLEARNLLGQDYEEFSSRGNGSTSTRTISAATVSLGLSLTF